MAANERKILTTLAIDGEKKYKAAMDQAYSGLRVLSSGLKANSTEFANNKNSIEGLTKRGELLNKEIAQQKEIVESLTKAVKEASEVEGDNTKQIDKYTIKLNNAKAALSKMENALDENNRKLSDAKSRLKAVSDGLGKLSTKLKTAGADMEKSGKTLTTHITAPILGAAGAALKLAADYEETIKKINTLDLSASSAKIQGIKGDITALSNDTGTAATAISEATYQMGSALGSLGRDVVDHVEIASKAAIGGFTDAATAVDGLTTVYNAYGKSTKEEMQQISDFMLTAQNLGKTTFGEIASNVGNVVKPFKEAGGGADELMASYAILTKNGIATAQSTTGIKAALSNVLKPTKEASAAAETLGLNFSAANIQAKGWSGMLNDINASVKNAAPEYAALTQTYIEQTAQLDALMKKKDASKKTDKALNAQIAALKKEMKQTSAEMEIMANAADSPIAAYATLFGSVEGLNSMLVLSSDEGLKQYNEAMGAMAESAGATEAAYEKMQEGISAKSRKVIQSVKNFGIEIGDKLIVKAEPALKWVQQMVGKLSELDDETINTAIKFAAVAAAAGPVVLVLGKLTSAAASVSKGLSLMVAHPAIAAIAAITIAAGALYFELNKTSAEMKAFERKANEVVKNTTDFRELVDNMTPNILNVNDLISSTGKTVGELQQTIDEKEAAINAILRTAAQERRTLREDELAQIDAYNSEIAALSEEKINMYRDVELAKLRQIQLEEGDLTAEQLAQMQTDMQEALDQANKVSEDAYVSRLATIENTYKTMGEVGSAAYLAEQQAAKANYEVQLQENQTYYDEALSSLLASSATLVGAERQKNTDMQIERQKDLEDAQAFYDALFEKAKTRWENVSHMDSEEAQNAITVSQRLREEKLAALAAEEKPWLDLINQRYEAGIVSTTSYYESLGKLDSEEAERSLTALKDKRDQEVAEVYNSFAPKLEAINAEYSAQYAAIEDKYAHINQLDSEQAQAELAAIKQRGEDAVNALIATYDQEQAAASESYDAQYANRQAAFSDLYSAYEEYNAQIAVIEESAIAQNKSYNAIGLANLLNVNQQKKNANSEYSAAFKAYLDKLNELDWYSFLQFYDTAKQAGETIPAEYTVMAKNMLAAFATAPEDMQDEGYQMLMGLLSGITDPELRNSLEAEGTDTAAEVVNAIWSEWDLGSPSRVAKRMGKNFVQGLEDGMNEKQQSASNTAATIGSLLVQTFKDVFGIRSPSTVMRDLIGKPMMEGWAKGLTDNRDLVSRAFGRIVPDTQTAALTLDVTRRFNDVARSVDSGQSSVVQSSTVTNDRRQTINYHYTVKANDLSYAQQRRQARAAQRDLVRELSANGV